MSISDSIRRLPAISLTDLTSDAALLTRVDRKYLVPAADAAHALNVLSPHTRVLEMDHERKFPYESVYFDTADRVSYHLAATSRRRRFKLRSRTYAASGITFLEMKTTGSRGTTVKERIEYDVADRAALTGEGRSYARAALAAIGMDPELTSGLAAAIVTSYNRTTLLTTDGSRATVDTALRWQDADGRELTLPHHVIVESKSAGRPTPLDHALWRAGHRPQGISKFATGVAALHPHLPSNKWARVLRRHFTDAPIVRGSLDALHSLPRTLKESA